MSSAAPFPNRVCPRRGNRLHRTESLRHSDSEASPLPLKQAESPASANPPERPPPPQSPPTASATSTTARPESASEEDLAHHPPNPPSDNVSHVSHERHDSNGGHTIPVARTPPPPPGPPPRTLEELRLRHSLALLQATLSTSTALINNLRAREGFHRRDGRERKEEWKRICRRREEELGEARRAVGRERRVKSAVLFVVAGVVLGLAGWKFVCGVQGPEREYVRRRRGEVFGG